MYEVKCLDQYGNTINNFFQWDIDQEITIKLEGCPQGYLSIAPEFHFTNKHRDTALIVRSNVIGEDVMKATIPNILLQEPYPLLVYVYLTNSEDVSSQRTILFSEIPIRKREMPNDYLYVENIKRITAEDIKDEIEASTEEARSNAIKDITDTKNSAIETVTQNKDSFLTIGNGLVKTATAIKDNTQKTYDDTVKVANQTKTKIKTDIDNMMTQDGLVLATKNDGEGNVTVAILLNSQEA